MKPNCDVHICIASWLLIQSFCLFCENGYASFKYVYFASWHDVQLALSVAGAREKWKEEVPRSLSSWHPAAPLGRGEGVYKTWMPSDETFPQEQLTLVL